MDRITTLFDNTEAVDGSIWPDELRTMYGGDLRFPVSGDAIYVIGNFVSTLDGVVSFGIPGQSGGGEISGFNAMDRFIMGLLRASADAVLVGAGTLRDTSAGHLWLADHVYPEAGKLYATYRQEVLNKVEAPLNVIVSGSGAVDLQKSVFQTNRVRTLVFTSPQGKARLTANGLETLSSVEARVVDNTGGRLSPVSILKLLREEFHVELLLHEGGPTLFGDFVAHNCVDELFLTMAPQLAGRDNKRQRPGILSGVAFSPESAPWLKVASMKRSRDHLYLRYRLSRRAQES
jgi:riboflavin biosynthesis pyrimidine reductase